MARRLTVSLDDELEQAIAEAHGLLGLPRTASDSGRLRAYARMGYRAARESKLEDERLATYRRWADLPESSGLARTTSRATAQRGTYEDISPED